MLAGSVPSIALAKADVGVLSENILQAIPLLGKMAEDKDKSWSSKLY